MTPQEARTAIREAIAAIAPEIDLDRVDRTKVLADQVELDSMDQLNVMIEVANTTGIEIPERDYPDVRTLEAFEAYIVSHSI